ncbi:hypothetical protein A4G29_03945 [Mycobacterium kansasii]|nr:hypothetical protein A4G29_03945 [Mycobacterium kansasii]
MAGLSVQIIEQAPRHRDLASARTSWQRARIVADGLPTTDPARVRLQIQSQTLLCATAFLAARNAADTGFEELRELCTAAGDGISLAIGMSGIIMALAVNGRARDAAHLAGEFTELVESIADPTLTVALFYAGCYAKLEVGEVREAWRLAQRAVDLAAGDPTKGSLIFGSPLAMATGLKGFVGICLGMPGWQADSDAAIAMAAPIDPTIHVVTIMWKHVLAIPFGVLAADTTALADTAEALRIAEQTGDELVLGFARLAHGLTQIHHGRRPPRRRPRAAGRGAAVSGEAAYCQLGDRRRRPRVSQTQSATRRSRRRHRTGAFGRRRQLRLR